MVTEKRKPFDVRAVNPRYGTAKLSDVAKALMRPKDPDVRAKLEGRRSVTRGKVSENDPSVKSSV